MKDSSHSCMKDVMANLIQIGEPLVANDVSK